MMYAYDGLLRMLSQKDLKKSDLTRELHISSRTVAKIAKGEKLGDAVMQKLCAYFSCAPDELYRSVPDNALLRRLREEKEHRLSGGIYHELQIRMTYNSNHIEGSRLSEDETRRIFETNTVGAGEMARVDDIIETVNHFRAIDYCIDCAEDVLTEEIVKKLHYLLKSRTSDELLPYFRVGEYKARPNMVGGVETTQPQEVAAEMALLLRAYHAKQHITFEDVVDFHWRFERIHPFQDGNGRVGRLIVFKECLKHGIVPFLIEDVKKGYYYRGLKEYAREPGYLVDTCYDGQDTFRQLMEFFQIKMP